MTKLHWLLLALTATALTACASLTPTLTSSLDTVFTVAIAGGSATQVVPLSDVTGAGQFRHARWSPSGTQIVSYSVTHGDIYLCTSTGNTRTNLTNTSTITESDPEWAPSGDLIAYLGTNSSGISSLYIMTNTGSSQTALLSGIYRLGWNANSTRLWAMGTNQRIYLVTPSGSVTALESTYVVDSGTTPAWAGTATVRFVSGGITYLGSASGVVPIRNISNVNWGISSAQAFVDLDSNESTGYWVSTTGNIVSLGRADLAVLSPSGNRIALALRGTVYTIPISTLARTVAMDTGGYRIQSITWTPDNQTLLIASTGGLVAARYDGSSVVSLSGIGSGDFDLSPHGQSVVYIGVREEKL